MSAIFFNESSEFNIMSGIKYMYKTNIHNPTNSIVIIRTRFIKLSYSVDFKITNIHIKDKDRQ